MTTITCSSNCIHQKDGVCTLESAFSNSLSNETDCAFFKEVPAKKEHGFNCKSQNALL
jgi:hypothetical protein